MSIEISRDDLESAVGDALKALHAVANDAAQSGDTRTRAATAILDFALHVGGEHEHGEAGAYEYSMYEEGDEDE